MSLETLRMKPCTTYYHAGRHFAWDEHGRLIGHRQSARALGDLLTSLGYYIEPFNSPFSARVRDRLRLRYPSLANEATQATCPTIGHHASEYPRRFLTDES